MMLLYSALRRAFFCGDAAVVAAEELLQELLEGVGTTGTEALFKTASTPPVPSAEWPREAADLVLHKARIESYGLYRYAGA